MAPARAVIISIFGADLTHVHKDTQSFHTKQYHKIICQGYVFID